MNPRSKEFKKLQKEWNQKLAKAGFEDQERLINGDMVLKRFHSRLFKQVDPAEAIARMLYYQLAGAFLYSHRFQNSKLRAIWTMHCEGLSVLDIAKAFPRRGTSIQSRGRTIQNWITKLKREMIEAAHGF